MKKLIFAILALATLITWAATRAPIYVAGNTQILAGTAITSSDTTVTQTFSTAFSAVPVVVCSQIGLDTTTTNVIAVTSSNFVLTTGKVTHTNKWVAIGTP